MSVTPYLRKLLEQRAPLTRVEAASLLNLILTGQASDAEIAAVLGALAARGETAEELAGFADATRAAATPFPLDEAERSQLVDTCGTGGDGADTFNISTAAALVAPSISRPKPPQTQFAPTVSRISTPRRCTAP
jgi:anthranilate phosphoribosyltransferase